MADIRINALANTATSAASDDYLALDGSANGTRKILATNVAQNVTDVTLGSAGPSVKSTLSARAPRQGLVADGTAESTATITSALGSTDKSFSFVVQVNENGNGILHIGTANLTVARQIQITLLTTRKLRVELLGATTGDIRQANTDNAIADNGKFAHVVCTISGATLTIYVNGVSVAYTQVTAGTPPAWSDAVNGTAVEIGGAAGTDFASTVIQQPLIYNRALSAAEVVALYEAGAPAAVDFNVPGAGTAMITGDNSTFASDTGWWTLAGGTPATISGGKANFTNGSSYIQRNNFFTIGKKYLITVGSLSGTVVYDDGATSSPLVAGQSVIATPTATYLQIFTAGGGWIDDITVVPLGLLLAPDAAQAGGGYIWNDQSGNLAQIVLPSSGVQWNLPSVAGQRIRGTTSTNGNQQLLGASVLLPAECQITHVRARARSGTPTITIGTASGGAQIVASVALSTTWLNCTIALTGGIVSSADDIWVGSNSTDVVETDIAFQPLDF